MKSAKLRCSQLIVKEVFWGTYTPPRYAKMYLGEGSHYHDLTNLIQTECEGILNVINTEKSASEQGLW